MQKYFNTVLNQAGAPVGNATVTVTQYPSGAAATIYSDNGVTPIVTLITDAYGYFEFYAADGRYSVSISGSNLTTKTVMDIWLEDPADKQDLLISGTNIKTINGSSILGSGNLAIAATPSGPKIVAQSGVANSVTGTISETALATVTIPAGTMGPNSSLHITTMFTFTGSAGTKSVKVSVGGVVFTNLTSLSSTLFSDSPYTLIRNRGQVNSQIAIASLATQPFGASTSATVTANIDFSQDQQVVFYGTLANAADTITLAGYTVEVK